MEHSPDDPSAPRTAPDSSAPLPPGGSTTSRRRRAATALTAAALLAGVVVVRAFVATPVSIGSSSMEPTYSAGDVVLIGRSAPSVEDLARGDLVVFASPEDGRRALKRVVGLPGEQVVIKDALLYVDDRVVEEPYVDHELIDGYYSRTFRVPDGSVFLLGDNRGNSTDSRDYGSVPEDELLGRVLLRLWPPFG